MWAGRPGARCRNSTERLFLPEDNTVRLRHNPQNSWHRGRRVCILTHAVANWPGPQKHEGRGHVPAPFVQTQDQSCSRGFKRVARNSSAALPGSIRIRDVGGFLARNAVLVQGTASRRLGLISSSQCIRFRSSVGKARQCALHLASKLDSRSSVRMASSRSPASCTSSSASATSRSHIVALPQPSRSPPVLLPAPLVFFQLCPVHGPSPFSQWFIAFNVFHQPISPRQLNRRKCRQKFHHGNPSLGLPTAHYRVTAR